MSTKVTTKYINTDMFSLHLYTDFAGSPAIHVRVNDASTTLLLSQEEHDDIKTQFEEANNG